MNIPEFNDDVYLQMARAQSNSACGILGNIEAARQNQYAANNYNAAASIFGIGYPRPLSKLELAKKWLKDNGGAHPGCLQRFMQAKGVK